jgi:hypothetical protein
MNPDAKSRDELAREANEVRSKLLRTVEQLDRRRRDAFDVRLQLQRHAWQFALGGALFLLGTAGVVALVAHRVATAPQRRQKERWYLARRVWQHPDRSLRGERRSFPRELARSLLLTAGSALLAVPIRRVAAGLLEERPERH